SVTPPSPTVLSTLSLHDALPIFCDLHAIFHQITASPFDHPRGDGIPLGQVVWIVEVRDVIGQVGRALIDRFALFWVQSLHGRPRSEEHTSELQSRSDIVCRLLLE